LDEEGPYVQDKVDLDDWGRKVRNINAAMRMIQVEARQPKSRSRKGKEKPVQKPIDGSSPSLP
jgi:hypothetical protein